VNNFNNTNHLLFFISNLLAVQKERDRLGRQHSNNYNYKTATIKIHGHIDGDLDEDDDDLSIIALLRAEQTAKEVR